MSHIWMSHVTPTSASHPKMNQSHKWSLHVVRCDMTQKWYVHEFVNRGNTIGVTWLKNGPYMWFPCACAWECVAVCCSVLQCVAVCCSVLQCAAVCCSVLQCVTNESHLRMHESHTWSIRVIRMHATHMNESCLAYEWVMFCIWMSHATHMNEPCLTYECVTSEDAWVTQMHTSKCVCRTFEWVMSHIWMSHVTHMNESWHTSKCVCRTYEWVMSHVWMSHVTHMNAVMSHMWMRMSHIWMSHVTHMNESCHTYEWVMTHIWMRMSHIWMSHVTRMNESCPAYTFVTSHVWISHVTHTNESHPRMHESQKWSLNVIPMRMCMRVCCSVLQCVAVCCSVLQCDAVCCSMLQCVAVCRVVLLRK